MPVPSPSKITVKRKSRVLDVTFADGQRFELPFEYLRVYSPSAEVQGHGPGQEVLQFAKENVLVTGAEPVGHYAVRLIFDDGHDSGLYTWKYLYELGVEYEKRWQRYLKRLASYGYQRRPVGN